MRYRPDELYHFLLVNLQSDDLNEIIITTKSKLLVSFKSKPNVFDLDSRQYTVFLSLVKSFIMLFLICANIQNFLFSLRNESLFEMFT